MKQRNKERKEERKDERNKREGGKLLTNLIENWDRLQVEHCRVRSEIKSRPAHPAHSTQLSFISFRSRF